MTLANLLYRLSLHFRPQARRIAQRLDGISVASMREGRTR